MFQAILVVVLAGPVQAQEARPVEAGAPTGYELALQGTVEAELGASIQLQGVAYEVDGLDTLRATWGLQVEASITALEPERQGTPGRRVEASRSSAVAGDSGRFVLSVPVPARSLASPLLEIVVHRPGQPGRSFLFDLSSDPPLALDLLTDRRRYEPGEAVHAWVRVSSVRSRAPRPDAPVLLSLLDPDGVPVLSRTLSSSPSGVASLDLSLPASARDGDWAVSASLDGDALAAPVLRTILVTRRTVERLLASVLLDHDLLAPGGPLSGSVLVRTPSGSPVRRARVELSLGSGDPIVLLTDQDGRAPFSARAPAFLSGDVASQTVVATVVHPAHGTARASASYTLSRVAWLVEATAEAGALVPELDSTLFLSVHDPRGRPIAAGTTLVVRGAGLPAGSTQAATDARGLASVHLVLPRGAASLRQSGSCQGRVATSVEVEVGGAEPVTARLCVPVAPDALVLPRAERVVVSPGEQVWVRLGRRAEVRGRPVVVEALWSGRAVAFAWAEPGQERVGLTVPDGLAGVLELRARPVWPSERQRPLDEPGATGLGVGASAAVVVRPADAFALSVGAEREEYRVRERARVELGASQAPGTGWVAMVVRDEAAHGGEGAWELGWIRRELEEAVSGGGERGRSWCGWR